MKMTKGELRQMIREVLKEELNHCKKKTINEALSTSNEYEIIYRVKTWKPGQTADANMYADNIADALEYFLDWVCDPESYDEGEPALAEDDYEILSIKKI
jgi:hypothetical protein